MKAKHIRWLLDELDGLAAEGILSAAAARRLRDHYTPFLEDRGRTRETVLAVLGAVLVGGGIILLLAHNWQDFGRPLRTVLAFAPLLAAQALALFAVARKSGSTAWREATATALSLALLSSIALIGQTYHIPGSFEDLLLTCSVLTLPVIYLLDAAVPAALFLAAIAAWIVESSPEPAVVPADLGYWLLLSAVLPYLASLWRRRPSSGRTLLAGWALAGSVLMIGTVTFDGLARQIWPTVAALTAALLALEGSRTARGLPWWKSPLEVAGTVGVFGVGLYLGSPGGLGELARLEPRDVGWVGGALWAVIAVALGRVAVLGLRSLRARRWPSFLVSLLPFLVALAHLGGLAGWPGPAGLIAFNLLVAVWTLAALARGLREGRSGLVHLSLAGFAALILFRFFESDLSLVIRGVGFVAVGLGFLLANVYLNRRLQLARGATS